MIGDGIVCYVTNNSFIDQIAFDGMRKHLCDDFTTIYHVDLHGNVRQNPKLSGTTHNVFGIQVGVGITVAVRSKKHIEKKLLYYRVPEYWIKEQKLAHLTWNVDEDGSHNSLNTVEWEVLKPNKKYTWLIPEHSREFEDYIPLGTKNAKRSEKLNSKVIFINYGRGVATTRDAYVYDFEKTKLNPRIKDIISKYNSEVDRFKRTVNTESIDDFVDYDKVKWSESLKASLKREQYISYDEESIREALYRPFTKQLLYFDGDLTERRYQFHYFMPTSNSENKVIIVGGYGRKDFAVSFTNIIPDLNFYADPAQCFPFYVYDEDGSNRRENITDWALGQFREQYGDASIGKWDIFYYVYGLLHHPDYRERYADNLKRELPRIPFVPSTPSNDDTVGAKHVSPVQTPNDQQGRLGGSPLQNTNDNGFWIFSKAGKELAELHLNYETGDRYPLAWEINEAMPASFRVEKMRPKKKRDAKDGNYKVYDTLQYNDYLTLTGIPEQGVCVSLGESVGVRLGGRSISGQNR